MFLPIILGYHCLSGKGKAAVIFLILCLGYIFVLAGSHTVLVVLIVSVCVMLYYLPLRVKGAHITVCVVISVALSLGGFNRIQEAGPLALINRVQADRTDNDARFPIWRGVLKASEASTFTGLGIGQFKAQFRQFYTNANNPLIKRIIDNGYFLSPHSDYLAFLVIYGVIGFTGYLFFCLSP